MQKFPTCIATQKICKILHNPRIEKLQTGQMPKSLAINYVKLQDIVPILAEDNTPDSMSCVVPMPNMDYACILHRWSLTQMGEWSPKKYVTLRIEIGTTNLGLGCNFRGEARDA